MISLRYISAEDGEQPITHEELQRGIKRVGDLVTLVRKELVTTGAKYE